MLHPRPNDSESVFQQDPQMLIVWEALYSHGYLDHSTEILLMWLKEESEQAGLKLNIKKQTNKN